MLACTGAVLIYSFIVFIFLLNILDLSEVLSAKEYTGKLANAGQFPFAIRLYSKFKDSMTSYCTATIITSNKLLTAGHCCHVNAFRFVVLGDPDQTDFVSSNNKSKYIVHDVEEVILHPNFERSSAKLIHDLCLLILKKPMSLSDGYDTIKINYEKLKSKKNCTALGWGTNFGHQLQHKLYYKEATGYRCNLQFGNSSKYWFVCLEPHSVCPGDSGGPLVCEGMLYGIASFFIGHREDVKSGCENGAVDFYTELASEKEFIEKNGVSSTMKLRVTIQFIYLYTFCLAITCFRRGI